MATSYIIDLGYFSGSKFKGGEDEAWKALKNAVAELREHVDSIVHEVQRVEPLHENDLPELRELASAYKATNGDLTLRIVEQQRHEQPPLRYVAQCASGERYLKEIVRRAFCRLVIKEMHRQGIEVNVRVS
jgi:hypothetical protein